MMGSSGPGSGSGSGSGPVYLDPDHVYALFVSRRPHDLFRYLNSIPGASEDVQCRLVSLAGMCLLAPLPRAFPDEESRALYLAQFAWVQAASSRLRAPQMVANASNFASAAGHYMHPLNPSSYSGRMLTTQEPGSNVLRHSAMQNQLSASNSRIPTATFPPLQENSNLVLSHSAMPSQLSASSSRTPAAAFPPLQENSNDVNNFPIRRAGTLNEKSAFNSGTHASAYVPLQDNSTHAQAFAELSMGQPGSEQMAPQALMQNREVLPTVGMRPASEVDQLKGKILRLHVASMISEDGTKCAAGVLIRDFSTAQFIRASCFTPILYMEPSLLFAAACSKGIKGAQSFQPTSIVLETHQLPLLNSLHYAQTPHPEFEYLSALINQNPPELVVRSISIESNRAACQLGFYALRMQKSDMVFNDPPEWLVPYLAGCQDQ